MKEMYEKPMAEKIVFSYKEQVVAASGGGASGTCNWQTQNNQYEDCTRYWQGNNS